MRDLMCGITVGKRKKYLFPNTIQWIRNVTQLNMADVERIVKTVLFARHFVTRLIFLVCVK